MEALREREVAALERIAGLQVSTALERLAAGIRAALTLRLISGNTDQTYTPNEVAVMVSEVIDQQYDRLVAEGW